MADVIWVFAELTDDGIRATSLEMLAKAAQLAKAEAVLLGPAPEEAVKTLAKHGASKIYRCADQIYSEYNTLPADDTVAVLIDKYKPAVMLFAYS